MPRHRHNSRGISLPMRILFAAFALAMFAGSAWVASAKDDTGLEQLQIVTSRGEHKFDIEIARTREEQSRGLMFRRDLGPRRGMLFLYDDPQFVSMWMRNTYIPLDMIFILPDGKVHRIEASTEPLSERIIESGERISAVLEIAGGISEKIELKPGDMVRHPHFKPSGG